MQLRVYIGVRLGWFAEQIEGDSWFTWFIPFTRETHQFFKKASYACVCVYVRTGVDVRMGRLCNAGQEDGNAKQV